jgi:hypothetical protein
MHPPLPAGLPIIRLARDDDFLPVI